MKTDDPATRVDETGSGIRSAFGRRALLERHQAALLDLAKLEVKPDDLNLPLRILTEVSARTLFVERVGIWIFDEGRTKISCLELYEGSRDEHTRGQELHARDAPVYFSALEENRALAAHDVQNDPRTAELTGPYLRPLGIVSMLDAPIRQGGRIVGVVCHEHVGSMRLWSPEEENFASSIADMTALVLEHHERVRAEEELRRRDELLDGVARAANRLFADAENDVRRREAWLKGLAAAAAAIGDGDPQRALERLAEPLELSSARVFTLRDAEGPILALALGWEVAPGGRPRSDRRLDPAALAAAGRSTLDGGVARLTAGAEAESGEGLRLAAPLVRAGAVVGYLEIEARDVDEWAPADVWALEAAAGLFAGAAR